jgi:uncharacterized protein YciI
LKTWICVLRPAFDRAFLASADERTRALVNEHGDYLADLRDAGKLVLAGRCWDGPFGAVILEAADREEAEALVGNDPSVAAGVQTAELYEFDMPFPPALQRTGARASGG